MCGGVERSGTPLLRQLLSLLPPSLGLLSRPFSARSGASKNQGVTVTPFLSSPKQLARPVFGSSFVLGRAFRFFAVRDQKEGERVQASGLLFGLLQFKHSSPFDSGSSICHSGVSHEGKPLSPGPEPFEIKKNLILEKRSCSLSGSHQKNIHLP